MDSLTSEEKYQLHLLYEKVRASASETSIFRRFDVKETGGFLLQTLEGELELYVHKPPSRKVTVSKIRPDGRPKMLTHPETLFTLRKMFFSNEDS